MSSARADRRLLQRLVPTENGITVFDAETQETSYGINVIDGLPYIFDTHRKEGHYVATIELLTEVVAPVRIGPARIERFGSAARALGLLPVPYSGCFFKGNLHVYSFSGPVRGLDLSAIGPSVEAAERALNDRVRRLWSRVPSEILRAQRDLLAGERDVRHPEDLEVLRRRARQIARMSPD